jgi:membrane-associated protease RseP (regulator of RpoE activity)
MHRKILSLLAIVVSLAPAAQAQVAGGCGGNCGNVRVRVGVFARDSAGRARQERLLIRFDSLRYLIENERMSDNDRERLAAEMHRTVMALQESLDDGTMRTVASARASRAASAEALRMAPEIAIAVQSGYAAPGYVGVSFDGPNVEEVRRSGERIIRFLDYPRIALVEPSSPAERAGIEEGDTLLALDGADVRTQEISLSKLLIPNRRILVRVRREGNPKDFRVKVDEAPGYVVSRRTPMPPMPSTAPMPSVPPMAPTPVRVYPGEDLPRRAPMGSGGAIAATPTAMARSIWVMTDGVAGAKVETINEGLAKTIGVKSGVLVLRVAPGTPAYESGLRDGDVILRAAGRQVSSVRELRALIEGEHDTDVKLMIQRERRQRELNLRW